MILTCSDIQVAFGADPVLLGISFGIRRGEKLALAGANGTGKTTLLRVITGELKPDSGSVTRSDALRIGYLAQMQHEADDRLIYDYLRDARRASFDDEARLRDLESEMRHAEGEALDALMRDYTALQERYEQSDGFRAESDVLGVFRGLGFEDADKERRIGTLSGGQKTRVALGRLLLTEPDLLLLDEPTNHLDLKSVQFLEQFLTSYKGAVLLVSHDRYFLDRVVTRVIEIERGRALSFEGNYTQYSQKKAAYRNAELRAYEKQQDEIRHQEAVIAKLRQYNREKSIRRAESREKKLQNMQLVEAPGSEAKQMRLVLSPRRESGQDVLDVDRIGKSFDGAALFSSQSFDIRRGERVALIGANGTGKTTLLRIIAGLLDPDEGSIRLGTNVHCGYFDQEHRNLDPQKDIFSQIQDRYPTLTAGQIRNTLAAFLFTGDDVFQTIGSLSGGEQGRVALAQLMLSEANFLLLDEPTNHLDVPSKEILEEALNAYSGTVLYVSHDRYFINQTATRVLSLEDGQFISYIGNYDDYLSAREKRLDLPGRSDDADSGKQPTSEARQSWEAAKKQQAEVRKRENAIAKLEEAIAANEARIAEIDAELSLPETGTDLALCQSLTSEQEALNEELAELYAKWEHAAEQV